jgi:DNA-binding NarL/FixJ family response regulator
VQTQLQDHAFADRRWQSGLASSTADATHKPQLRATGLASAAAAGLMVELLEELDTPVIVCDDVGRVQLANSAARRELLAASPLGFDEAGQLRLSPGAQACELPWRQALRKAVQMGRRQLLALRDGSQTLMVSVMPLSDGVTTEPTFALVMLARRQPAPAFAVQMLGKLYALTTAEQDILVGLMSGERVEAIALRRGVKLCTLRTQVCAVRQKLGAQRLEDLVRLASELPPVSGALRSPPLAFKTLFALSPHLAHHEAALPDDLSAKVIRR